MSQKNFFLHNNQIFCESEEIINLIEKWTTNERWEFEDFPKFIELVGIKVPIKLSEYNKVQNSFKCISTKGEESTILLIFGDEVDLWSEIWVTEGKLTRKYFTNCNIKNGRSIPRVLQRKSNTAKEICCEIFYKMKAFAVSKAF